MPKFKKFDKQLTFALPQDHYDRLREIGDGRRESIADVVREMLEGYLESGNTIKDQGGDNHE